ncbi:hypothetical protein ACCO45_003894 [Purpureocillium lilacinum]|uniref:Uncharacterized protein n=1 Tax=Purpureocillium lilacinum TaxID=33203 RepID=A0ACC4E171_PURLI
MAASAPDTSGTRHCGQQPAAANTVRDSRPSKSHLLSGANSSRPDVQRQECLRYLMGAKRQCRAPAAFKHGVIRLPISLVSLITNAPSHRSDVHGDLLPRKASELVEASAGQGKSLC